MPVDVMNETHRTNFSSNLEENELYPNVIEEIKSIWLEKSYNADYQHWPAESFKEEVKNHGFIMGMELETVKAMSRRSLMQQMSNHISKNFQTLYGKENNGVRQNYFQIGVRVPSKEHVSEIVGKQGLKIKEIREKTGALIITPGESEDHVFIIEAIPSVALSVAKFIDERANEITNNRVRDNLQKSLIFNTPNRFGYNKPFTAICTSRPILATDIIEVPKNIVGRIIGTHGSIITTIQKDTGTEIRSPPKDNHLSNNNIKAKFEILVYQKSNSIDNQEAIQRIKNAKQLIAHVAMHQMERIRAEESPFSNYRIKNFTIWENNDSEKNGSDRNSLSEKEKLLNYQMQSVAWMWTDIDRLDDHVSEEVVLRILEESKKKSKLRTDYGNFESGNLGIDRFEESPLLKHSPFKQSSSFPNGYNLPPYIPSVYSDLSPTMNPTSPSQLNGKMRENQGSPYCTSNSYPPPFHSTYTVPSNTEFDFSSLVTSPLTSSLTSTKPTTLSYKTTLLNQTDPLTTKSYAEHLKKLTTSNYLTNTNLGALTKTVSSFPNNNRNHGAIGDHIKKINQNKTAQFDKI